MKTKMYDSPKGYVVDEDDTIKIYINTMANFDGIIDRYTNETWINYKNGLYQSWTATNYFAKYYDKYIDNKDEALRIARIELGLQEREVTV